MTKSRSDYSTAFKVEAVRLMNTSSKPIAELAQELGVSKNLLYRWRKQFDSEKKTVPTTDVGHYTAKNISSTSQTQPVEATYVAVVIKLRNRLSDWILTTLDPILLIVHLTIIYIAFQVADDFVLSQIESSLNAVATQSPFAAELLVGIKLFSALGVAIGYGLHTIYSLFLQAKHVVSAYRGSSVELEQEQK